MRKKDLVLAFIVVVMGTLLDSFYQDVGWIRYASPNRLLPFLAPFWISSLYLLLAINLDHSLRWLASRPYLAAILGVWGAVASYMRGKEWALPNFYQNGPCTTLALFGSFFVLSFFGLAAS